MYKGGPFETYVEVDTWANIVSRAKYLDIDGLHTNSFTIGKDFITRLINRKVIKITMDMQGIWTIWLDNKPWALDLDLLLKPEDAMRAELEYVEFEYMINNDPDNYTIPADEFEKTLKAHLYEFIPLPNNGVGENLEDIRKFTLMVILSTTVEIDRSEEITQ